MGELWFIGAGLSDERDLSRRAIEVLRRCDRLFAEEYTSVLAEGSLERLGAELGRPIERLDRAELEGFGPILDALSRAGSVALIVAGDPFAATTHVALRNEVARRGHTWHYLPNASILQAAAGFLGLQPYRFGPPQSLPFPAPSFAPTSPLERIAENRARGQHTLVLLDLRPSEQRYLTATEALRLIEERDPDGRWLPLGVDLAVVARVGGPEPRAWYGSRRQLSQVDFGPPLHALVIPAPSLHPEESTALDAFRVRSA